MGEDKRSASRGAQRGSLQCAGWPVARAAGNAVPEDLHERGHGACGHGLLVQGEILRVFDFDTTLLEGEIASVLLQLVQQVLHFGAAVCVSLRLLEDDTQP